VVPEPLARSAGRVGCQQWHLTAARSPGEAAELSRPALLPAVGPRRRPLSWLVRCKQRCRQTALSTSDRRARGWSGTYGWLRDCRSGIFPRLCRSLRCPFPPTSCDRFCSSRPPVRNGRSNEGRSRRVARSFAADSGVLAAVVSTRALEKTSLSSGADASRAQWSWRMGAGCCEPHGKTGASSLCTRTSERMPPASSLLTTNP
jgi:hypothetical protein